MPVEGNIQEFVNSIFAEDSLNQTRLKEFLLFAASLLSPPQPEVDIPLTVDGQPIEYKEKIERITYLDQLIKSCEERLEKLIETPKTRIIIRNEGRTLQSIIERLDCLNQANTTLQNQINELSTSHEKIKQLECQRKQKYQDLIDRLYQDSFDSDVCNLRKMYYGLQNQVDELIVRCVEMDQKIKFCMIKVELVDEIPKLRENIIKLLDWRASLREELLLLTERYEYVKTVKAGKCEVIDLLKNKVSYCHLTKYVHKTAFELARREFVEEFNQMKELFCELQLHLSEKLVSLSKDVQCVMSLLVRKRVAKLPPR